MKKPFFISVLLVISIVFFSQVFRGVWALPQAFSIGPVSVHYYGIAIALAVFAGYYFAIKRAPKFGVDSRRAEDILFWVIIGGFIGARLYHVLSSAGFYVRHPVDILRVWNGGLSIYGAILGGLITVGLVSKIFNPSAGSGQVLKSSILNLLDWLAPAVLLGQIIGRLGNLFNYELFGYPTGLPWGMFVPEKFRPAPYAADLFFHPLFLYEMLWSAAVLGFMWRIEARKRRHPGAIFFFYLLLYNLGRFFLEFLRIDSVVYGGVRVNALVSLALVIISTGWLLYRKRNVLIP